MYWGDNMETEKLEKETAQIQVQYKDEVEEIADVLKLEEDALRKMLEKDPFAALMEAYRKKEALLSAMEEEAKDVQYNKITGQNIAKDLANFQKYVNDNQPLPDEIVHGLEAATQFMQTVSKISRMGGIQGAFASFAMNTLKTVRLQSLAIMQQRDKNSRITTDLSKGKTDLEIEQRAILNFRAKLKEQRDLFIQMVDFINNAEIEEKIAERARLLLAKDPTLMVVGKPDSSTVVPGSANLPKPEKKAFYTEEDVKKEDS